MLSEIYSGLSGIVMQRLVINWKLEGDIEWEGEYGKENGVLTQYCIVRRQRLPRC